MSVIINLIEGNEVTIQRVEPTEVTLQNVLANQVTVQQGSDISVSLQNTSANQVNIVQEDNIGVTLTNQTPIAVTVNSQVSSGGGGWGSITGTITDQTDLVTYVDRARSQIEMLSPDGSTFTLLISDLGQLLVFSGIPNAPFIEALPTISGDVEVGRTLTAIPASVTGDPTPVITWQWQRKELGGDWSNIIGETSDTYAIGIDDFGDFLRVRQTATNIIGVASATSEETTAVEGNIIEITYIDPLKARMDVFEGEACALAALTALDNIDIV